MARFPMIATALLLAILGVAHAQPGLPEFSHVTVDAGATPDPVRPGGRVVLEFTLNLDEGWHVYGTREKTGLPVSLEILDAGSLTPDGPARIPPGEPHEAYGDVSYWLSGTAVLRQAFLVPEGTPEGEVRVRAQVFHQPCTEASCFEPETVPVEVGVTIALDGGSAESLDAPDSGSSPVRGGGDDSSGLVPFLLLAFGAGLFALVMPCTYPMIPITISYFTKQGENRTGGTLALSLAYGLGIVAIFVAVGIVIGPAVITFATHPATNLIIALLFVAFALALLGAWTLQPPRFLMNLANRASSKGGYLGIFLMGATLVVTSFTCTAPFVGSLLGAGASTGGVGRIALGMAVFGSTMAVPFVVLSLVPGALRSMPKSGEWMHTVKVFLGFVELAAALKFLSNAEYAMQLESLPKELFLVLWCGIFGVAALFLLGLVHLKGDKNEGIGAGRLVTGLATLLFALYCFNGSQGHRMDRIMLAIAPPYGDTVVMAERDIVVDDYDAARDLARRDGKPLFVNFTGFT
jgi:thiol:disulfide interchange protein